MSITITVLSIVLFIFGPIGDIGTSFAESPLPEPRPLGSGFRSVRPSDLGSTSETLPIIEVPSGAITLEQALALALINNPELIAFSWEIRARDAEALQSGLIPNPEIGLEIEEFGGPAFKGTDQAEMTISLSQRIELAGKRKKRKNLGLLIRNLAGWDYETKRLELVTEVTKLFIEVLGDQKKVNLSEALLNLAEQVTETVSKRVEAGKVSPVESVKANVALSTAKIDLDRLRRELAASRKFLAALWGSGVARFKTVEGNFDSVESIPDFEALAEGLLNNPEYARWEAELMQRQAIIKFEKAKAIPDLTIGGGFRQFNETDENAFVAGISIDLPVFDRNQWGIREAYAQRSKAEAERQAVMLRLRTALSEAYRALSTAHSESEMLKNDLLPGAEKAFEAVSEGYRLGKFDLLDVLDAQRTLSQARIQSLQVQIDLSKVVAEVEGLIGEALSRSGRLVGLAGKDKEKHNGK